MSQRAGSLLLETKDKDCRENKQPGSEQTQQIILIDVHMLMRLALQRAVTTFFHTCYTASFSSVYDLLTLTEEIAAHTIVLGPSIPLSDCFHLVQQLTEKHISCEIVIIQQDLHPETARMLIAQGVHGLLDESASEEDLAQAITTASYGNIFLSQTLCAMFTLVKPGTKSLLTEREIQVLARLKHGESNARIAQTLGLKEKTIEKYLTTIYDKLHVHSRAEALLCLQKLHF
jgi:DNA-binding NarL/FixJ family response regulator